MSLLNSLQILQQFVASEASELIICSVRRSGYDPDGHNCYLSAVEVNTLTNLDLVFDDSWSVYESYLADYCPQNVQPFPSGGGGSDGKYLEW